MPTYCYADILLNSREIDCRGMDHLPPLLPTLKSLCIRNGDGLTSLTPLPPNLRILELRNCRNFTAEEYAALPPTLTDLHIYDMPVRDVTVLPQWITKLVLIRTTIEELPAGVFPHLEELEIGWEGHVRTVCVPPTVIDTRLFCLPSLTKIVAFSPVCADIRLTKLPNLTVLPPFPSALKTFVVLEVPITMLPPFPNIRVNVIVRGTNLPVDLQAGKELLYPEPYISLYGFYNPKWLARINPILEEYDRTQKRTRLLRPELLAAAYSPERVAKWLGNGEGNWDLVDRMMGIA